jgi:hypothetical protein
MAGQEQILREILKIEEYARLTVQLDVPFPIRNNMFRILDNCQEIRKKVEVSV